MKFANGICLITEDVPKPSEFYQTKRNRVNSFQHNEGTGIIVTYPSL